MTGEQWVAGEGRDGDFRADLQKYYRIAFGERSPSLSEKLGLFAKNFGLQCVAVYRFSRYVRRLRRRSRIAHGLLRPLAAFLNQAMAFVHKVHVGADVGPGFYIGHVGNIYLGGRGIGRNFSVTHNVTIGRAPDGGGTPVLGDDVWIGTGSVVYGEVVVGDGVTLASGTVLSRSVPPGALVAGNPGRVIQTRYDNRRLFGSTRGSTARATAPVPEAPAGAGARA